MPPLFDNPPLPGFLGERVQMAFVVRDLDEALRYWTESMKIGPFVVIDNSIAGRTVVHRGQQTNYDSTLAFSYFGDVQVELVHPINNGPSPFNEFLDSGREGLQHFAFWPDDFEQARSHLAQAGYLEICSILNPDGASNASFYEPPAHIGAMVEIVPMTAARKAYFGRIQKLTKNWDGSRPIRRFASREAFLTSGEGAD